MAKYAHEQLATLSKPASDTEEEKMEHARKSVKDALANSNIVESYKYEVFGQGSYANNTNVRNNSDIDINVCYNAAYYFEIPEGAKREDHGLNNGDVPYSYNQFKNDIENMLVSHYGRTQVIRKNKCIHVKGNTYRTEIDVVPTWEHRDFRSSYFKTTFHQGVVLWSDDNEKVVNYPKQHLAKGIEKNNATKKRYKSLVRIVKNLSIKMEEDNYYINSNVTSFLLECLTYNYPNDKFHLNESVDWNQILREYIYYFWSRTDENSEEWKKWVEVSEELYLMYGHKWNREDVHTFLHKLWNYLQYQ